MLTGNWIIRSVRTIMVIKTGLSLHAPCSVFPLYTSIGIDREKDNFMKGEQGQLTYNISFQKSGKENFSLPESEVHDITQISG